MVRHKRIRIPHNVTFKDHSGKPAMMSWQGSTYSSTPDVELEPLPGLECWVFYVTSPDVRYADFDGTEFKACLECEYSPHNAQGSRYEFYFLPGASPEDCVEHYRDEMLARGTIWRQVREVKEAKEAMESGTIDPCRGQAYKEALKEGQQLPGLVWPIHQCDWDETGWYRGWFFLYPHADVKFIDNADVASREVGLVKFHPAPLPEELLDPGEEHINVEHMQRAIRTTWMPLVDRAGGNGWPSCALHFMDLGAQDHWRMAACDATDDARDMGWVAW